MSVREIHTAGKYELPRGSLQPGAPIPGCFHGANTPATVVMMADEGLQGGTLHRMRDGAGSWKRAWKMD